MLRLIAALLSLAWLAAAPALAAWKETSRTQQGEAVTAAETCNDTGRCLEIFTFEGEVWARLTLPESSARSFAPGAPPVFKVDGKDSHQAELYIVGDKELRFQLWDGRSGLPELMVRLIKGKSLAVVFLSQPKETRQADFSLRGSSPALKRILRALGQTPPE
jgi:hypothetical protein